jgi:DNA topoisomerase-1
MATNLVIVESPTKAKTIKKFLGKNYEVIASEGHVRDLPKSSIGIDKDNDFEPHYITIRGKGDLVASLKKSAKKADFVYLATDPDREGEAISYHLSVALKLDEKKYKRITFNEITKNAVKNAIKSPRDIDMDLVNAQQARRVIDRLVGYTISPLLWKKIRKGLSAGRVQSVALRMICDREAEIAAFTPEEYWSLDAHLLHGKKKLTAAFYGKDKKMALPDEASVDDVIKHIGKTDFTISDIKKSERRKKAPLPFTTSTMQQEAAKSLGFATSKTMKLAQTLYEDGYITYLRTDSTRISVEADAAAKIFISDKYGEEYVNGGSQDARKPQETEVKIQDAHEAIRPTDLSLTPEEAKAKLQRDDARLYTLIYKRFLASRMTSAVYDTESVKLDAKGFIFTLNGSKLQFDGFLSVYMSEEDKAEKDVSLPEMKEGEKLSFQSFDKEQHFTQPPAHYTEASLVKTLEEDGIGRPSTYAPTIGTLLARRYITKEKKNIFVTELGQAVDDMMQKNFPTIVDTAFTANMESLLDTVANGNINWKTIVENFYPDLSQAVEKAHQEVEKITIRDEETDIECDKCGRRMVIKYGPHGKFLACPGFPDCMNTKPYVEYAGFVCPDCGSECVKRRSKKGRIFFSCSNYPECNYMTWNKPKEATAGEKKDGEIMC